MVYKVTFEDSDKIYIVCNAQKLEEQQEQHKYDKKNAFYRYRNKKPKIELIVNTWSGCKKSLGKVKKCHIEYYHKKSGDTLINKKCVPVKKYKVKLRLKKNKN